MNKEKQRIAIAEACGMIGPFENSEEWFENGDSDGCIIVLRDATGKRIADYLNDLNAMHEAEEVLDPDDYAQYEQNLRKTYPVFMGGGFHLLHATAEQRAEAFLRTIGKWEADK